MKAQEVVRVLVVDPAAAQVPDQEVVLVAVLVVVLGRVRDQVLDSGLAADRALEQVLVLDRVADQALVVVQEVDQARRSSLIKALVSQLELA